MINENQSSRDFIKAAAKATDLMPKTESDNTDELPVAIDDLKLYFGDDIEVLSANDRPIVINQPTIGDFIEYGENIVYSGISPFVTNPTSCRLELWKQKIDWNKISDYKLFLNLLFTINWDYAKIFFPNHDFEDFNIKNASKKNFKIYIDKGKDDEGKDKNMVLALPNKNLLIDYETYLRLAGTIRYMLGIKLKNEYAKDKFTKKEIIREEMDEFKRNQGKQRPSNLLRMISFCLNHPGFKYKKNELREVGICEFLDSVKQLQVYETTNALIKGSYSGFIDTKKIDKKQFDFMRELNS